MNQKEYWEQKEQARKEAEEKEKFIDFPLPNRSDRRRKVRAKRLDESPLTKPSISKRVSDRKKRENSK